MTAVIEADGPAFIVNTQSSTSNKEKDENENHD